MDSVYINELGIYCNGVLVGLGKFAGKIRTFTSRIRALASIIRTLASGIRTLASRIRTFTSRIRTFISRIRTFTGNSLAGLVRVRGWVWVRYNNL